MTTIATVVGARPQFIKAATIARILRQERYAGVSEKLIHTGQHYDRQMSDVFFQDLGIPEPFANLKVGSGAHGAQTAAMLAALETTFQEISPDVVLAYGDTNSTMAAGLAAAKLNIPFVHAEAGERFFRRVNVPEEVNRVVSDAIASLCLTFTRRGEFYLLREGVARERVEFVGDPMFDIFQWGRNEALARTGRWMSELNVEPGRYYLSTIHRAENTLDTERFLGLVDILDTLDMPAVLPVHPRVAEKLRASGWMGRGNLRVIGPQAYSDFQCLLLNCRKCLTDSGGVMRETFFAGKPGVIPMINTWWPEIVENGWAYEAGKDLSVVREAMLSFEPPSRYPEGLFGDGNAAQHIVDAALRYSSGADGEAAWHWQGRVSQLPPNLSTGLTYDAYASLLSALAARGYEAGKLVVRHDMAFDLAAALPLARMERQAGVRAVYFVDPHSLLYNAASPDSLAILESLRGLGHEIGVLAEPATAAAAKAWLESMMGQAVTWTAHAAGGTFREGRPVDGAVLAMRDAVWQGGNPLKSGAVREGKPVILSTDPAWWSELARPPHQALAELGVRQFAARERAFAALSPWYRFGALEGE